MWTLFRKVFKLLNDIFYSHRVFWSGFFGSNIRVSGSVSWEKNTFAESGYKYQSPVKIKKNEIPILGLHFRVQISGIRVRPQEKYAGIRVQTSTSSKKFQTKNPRGFTKSEFSRNLKKVY